MRSGLESCSSPQVAQQPFEIERQQHDPFLGQSQTDTLYCPDRVGPDFNLLRTSSLQLDPGVHQQGEVGVVEQHIQMLQR